MALKREEVNGMWKKPLKFYLMITSGLFYLALFATSEPVCYTGEKLDDLNTVIRQTDCNGDPDLICARFASRKDATIFTVLNSPCGYGEGHLSPDTGSSQQNDIRAVMCFVHDLPFVINGSFDCSNRPNVSKGEACPLICVDGFYPSASKKAVCESGPTYQEGKWSEGNFTCDVIKCSTINLPTVQGGSFDCPNFEVGIGVACPLSCDDGFYLAFPDETRCASATTFQGGEWSVGNFTCLEYGCNKWIEWKESEYKVIDTSQSWDESFELCNNDSAHLVTIKDKKENDFVQALASHCKSSFSYIAFRRRKKDGVYEWINGEPVTYINWEPSHPGGLSEKCAYISKTNGLWADYYCSYSRRAVCERNKTPT